MTIKASSCSEGREGDESTCADRFHRPVEKTNSAPPKHLSGMFTRYQSILTQMGESTRWAGSCYKAMKATRPRGFGGRSYSIIRRPMDTEWIEVRVEDAHWMNFGFLHNAITRTCIDLVGLKHVPEMPQLLRCRKRGTRGILSMGIHGCLTENRGERCREVNVRVHYITITLE